MSADYKVVMNEIREKHNIDGDKNSYTKLKLTINLIKSGRGVRNI
jgi:hypothetical protein